MLHDQETTVTKTEDHLLFGGLRNSDKLVAL